MGTSERAFSHVALTVGRGEGPLAARLLGAFGLGVTDKGPSLQGDPWYTALLDPDVHDGTGLRDLGYFVVPVSDEQLRLEAALGAEVAAECTSFVAAKWAKPDSFSHAALNYASLEAVERAVRALAADADLVGRCDVRAIRPVQAPPDLERRLDESDVFAAADRVRYLTAGVQVFVSTDVVSAGLLCLRQSFELNFEVPAA